MGRRDRRELESRLRLMLHHLLKWRVQPGLRGRSWQRTLIEQRRQAEKLLNESPSLRPQVPALIDEAYPDALRGCHRRNRATAADLPRRMPFHGSTEQILDPQYLPDEES